MKTSRVLISSFHEWKKRGILSVLGPTGAGKTSSVLRFVRDQFASDLKRPLLVSVDSIAVYRDLDIGSAKPMGFEREDFDWVGLDIVSPNEPLTAMDYLRAVQEPIKEALLSSRPVIFVGGSFFYERVLVNGPGVGSVSEPEYLMELQKRGIDRVYQEICAKEPSLMHRFGVQDTYRVLRYADLLLRQGLLLADLDGATKSPFDCEIQTMIIGLDPPVDPSKLLSRIRAMLEQGWEGETQSIASEFGPNCVALKSVGYREVLAFQNGAFPRNMLEEKILISHRQLAKKQRTWLRGILKSLN